MSATLSTDLTNLAVTNYRKEYFRLAALPEYQSLHSQFVDWKETIPDRGGFGGTFDWPVFGRLNPNTTALTEGVDITPKSFKDYNVTLSPAEYGDAVAYTNLAQFKSRVDLQTEVADMVSQARVQSPGHDRPQGDLRHHAGRLDAADADDSPRWFGADDRSGDCRHRHVVVLHPTGRAGAQPGHPAA